MTLYCGIDLHANNSVVAIIDEQDRIRFEKRLPNSLEAILSALSAFASELAGCVVASSWFLASWRPLERTLKGWSWNRPTTGIGWSMA